MSELGPQLGPTIAFLNAILNASSAICLLSGFVMIRRGNILWHRRFMVATFSLSVIFLLSYLTRFYLTGVHRFPGEGSVRTFYLWLLGSHTILAAATPVLAIRTLYLALKGRFEEHRRIAKITWPIWMYVSVTGVMVYYMLYHLV